MVHIIQAAKAAVAAYAAAVGLGGNPSTPTTDVSAAMASLYLANFTSFTLGAVTVFANETVAANGIAGILFLYDKSGLGTDIRLRASRVERVSDQAALCWLTWRIYPRNGVKPWSFVDLYGFRAAPNRTGGLEGGWEFSNADNEYEELLKRAPNFFGMS